MLDLFDYVSLFSSIQNMPVYRTVIIIGLIKAYFIVKRYFSKCFFLKKTTLSKNGNLGHVGRRYVLQVGKSNCNNLFFSKKN